MILILAAGIPGIFFSSRIIRKQHLEEKIHAFLTNITGQFSLLIFFTVVVFVLLAIPSQGLVYEIFAAGLCFWLIGIQALLLFPAATQAGIREHAEKILAAAALLGMYVFLAIPSRLPGVFDGIPWNTPLEFISAALLIPLCALLNWRILGKKYVVAAILLLVILRAGTAILIPETGLGVRSYREVDNVTDSNWYETYSSILKPAYSDVMKGPYQSLLEFPVDWMTLQDMVSIPKPLVEITIQGFGRLEPGEQLVFITQGLVEGDIQLTDLNSGEVSSAAILNTPIKTAGDSPINNPNLRSFAINGDITFKNEKNYQISARIVRPDHSSVSAFNVPKLWLSKSIFQIPPSLISISAWLIWLEDVAFGMILVTWLAKGLFESMRQEEIKPLDIFLGITAAGVLGFIFVNMTATPLFQLGNNLMSGLQRWSSALIALNCVISLVARYIAPTRSSSSKGFLVSVGIIVLVLFLLLYLENLKQFTLFSRLDDPFEYQAFARNIFTNGDFLNLQTPPRAYKFLFPYLVGLLHLLFGESSSAQFYLNAWCGVLSAMLMIEIISKSRASVPFQEAAGFLFILLLFGNYFFLYFGFGLIEPVAVLFLISFFYFAQKNATAGMLLTGIITLLLRLDYAGAVVSGLVLNMPPVYGSFHETWSQMLGWVKIKWARLAAQITILLLPSMLVLALYSLLIDHYMLGDGDTANHSLLTVMDGFMRVIFGGNLQELQALFRDERTFTIVTTLILVGGTLLGLCALLLRFKLLRYVDLRWSVIIVGLLAVYLIVHPTGYPPRFSTPLLPIAVMILASSAIQIWKVKQPSTQGVP